MSMVFSMGHTISELVDMYRYVYTDADLSVPHATTLSKKQVLPISVELCSAPRKITVVQLDRIPYGLGTPFYTELGVLFTAKSKYLVGRGSYRYVMFSEEGLKQARRKLASGIPLYPGPEIYHLSTNIIKSYREKGS